MPNNLEYFVFKYPINIFVIFLMSIFLINGCAERLESKKAVAQEFTPKNIASVITGSVTYRERMMLPPNAELNIYLEDVSRMDAPSEILAKTTLSDLGAPPYQFKLAYDPTKIVENRRYGLRTRIEVGGKLLLINTYHVDPFDKTRVEALEVLVSRTPRSNRNTTLDQPKPDASLVNTYWKLIELNRAPIVTKTNAREIHLTFVLENAVVRGSSGCNVLNGTYQLIDDKLKFGPLLSSMRACLAGMAQEQAFLKTLDTVRFFSIDGDMLVLRNEKNESVMHFEAVYLR